MGLERGGQVGRRAGGQFVRVSGALTVEQRAGCRSTVRLPACPPARLHYVAQSVADLRYLLCPAPLDPARWQALDRARLVLPWGSLELTIIGASHVLALHSGDQDLTEVLACLPPCSPPVPAVVARPAAGRWRASSRCGPVRYTTRFALWRYGDAAVFAATQAAILARRPALLRLFPAGPAAVAPLTALDWRVSGARVRLATYHTYPLERAIAITETAIAPIARGEKRTADGPPRADEAGRSGWRED